MIDIKRKRVAKYMSSSQPHSAKTKDNHKTILTLRNIHKFIHELPKYNQIKPAKTNTRGHPQSCRLMWSHYAGLTCFMKFLYHIWMPVCVQARKSWNIKTFPGLKNWKIHAPWMLKCPVESLYEGILWFRTICTAPSFVA